MSLFFIDKLKDNATTYASSTEQAAFASKVTNIATALGIDPNWLMLNMFSESSLDPTIVNNTSGATGLIQFMPSTATSLGTTTAALGAMDPVSQLDYVLKYYQPYAGKMKSFEDLYLVDFFPAALGYADDQCIGTASISCASVAAENPAIDINGDGQITMAEFKAWTDKKLPFGYQSQVGRAIMAVATPVTDSPWVVIAIVVLFLTLIGMLIKRAYK